MRSLPDNLRPLHECNEVEAWGYHGSDVITKLLDSSCWPFSSIDTCRTGGNKEGTQKDKLWSGSV